MSALTPFQTVGPYWTIGLGVGIGPLPATYPGARVVISGRLIDGAGVGIPDGVLEWWHPVLPCIQRATTEDGGGFCLETVKAPHFAIRVLGRGILTHYVTRLYFADGPDLADDPVLALVPQHRRHTLITQPTSPHRYLFDVIVQGENETVFFDI